MTPRTLLRRLAACLTLALLLPAAAEAQVYELRTYVANEGKLDDLNARFRDHTMRLFARHGIESIGYWTPAAGPASKNTLVYVVRHASRAAAKDSWDAFRADADWQAAAKASEADGAILSQPPESVSMEATDYSPKIVAGTDPEALYELRTYKAAEGKLDALDARFRDHTVRLFRKHGIESVAYWHPADGPEAKDTLIYIVRHRDADAAAKSWSAFGADPEWRKAAAESQKDGSLLAERPASVYMKPTDYSPRK